MYLTKYRILCSVLLSKFTLPRKCHVVYSADCNSNVPASLRNTNQDNIPKFSS